MDISNSPSADYLSNSGGTSITNLVWNEKDEQYSYNSVSYLIWSYLTRGENNQNMWMFVECTIFIFIQIYIDMYLKI